MIVTGRYGHARVGRALGSLFAVALCGLMAVALAACDSSSRSSRKPGGLDAAGKPAPRQLGVVGGLEYRLGIGDKVKIVVLGQSDLGGELEVDAGGKIVVALIGEITAAERSVGQVQ